jgi:hypothetical protein
MSSPDFLPPSLFRFPLVLPDRNAYRSGLPEEFAESVVALAEQVLANVSQKVIMADQARDGDTQCPYQGLSRFSDGPAKIAQGAPRREVTSSLLLLSDKLGEIEGALPHAHSEVGSPFDGCFDCAGLARPQVLGIDGPSH